MKLQPIDRMRHLYNALMEQTGAVVTVPINTLIELAEGLPRGVPLEEMLQNIKGRYNRLSGIARQHYLEATGQYYEKD